jgi:hypothetical protein
MKFIQVALAAAGMIGSTTALLADYSGDSGGGGEDQNGLRSFRLHGRQDRERGRGQRFAL